MNRVRLLGQNQRSCWKKFSLGIFVLIGLLSVHLEAYSTESSISEGITYSAFHTFFDEAIAQGKTEVVEFSPNPDCMDGRKLKSADQRNDLNCGPLLRAYHFKSAGKAKAKLLVVHGMQSNAGWFLSGPDLAEKGIEVLAFDRRGSGMSQGSPGHVDDFEQFYIDMDAATMWLWEPSRKDTRDVPVHLHANCFGTRVSIPYMQERMEETTRKYLVAEWEKLQAKLAPADRVPPEDRQGYLDDIQGFKYVSVINTSPATHMSHAAEQLFRDNIDCIMQIVQSDKKWKRRSSCFTEIDGRSGKELANYLFDLDLPSTWAENRNKFKAKEFSCLKEYWNDFSARLKTDTGCTDAQAALLSNPDFLNGDLDKLTLSEEDYFCIDSLISANILDIEKDACSDKAFADLKSTGIDPEGIEKFKSPLSDELFTNNPEYLSIIARDETALRELSRRFLYATHDMSIKMNNYLKGQNHDGEILPSTFGTSVLVFLQTKDLMVENNGIIHEYVAAHKGAPITKSDDLLNLCQSCNPKLYRALSLDADGAIVEDEAKKAAMRSKCEANKETLLACPYPQDVLQCQVSGREGEAPNCGTVETAKLIDEPRIRRRSDSIKRLVELDCDHFMEFCSDQEQTQKYRQKMVEWLLMPRWQLDWKDFFEADFLRQ